jgi:hypothetical protein
LFAFRLAKDLGLTLETVLEMSMAEFIGWAAFYKIEQDETKKAMNKRSR